MFSFLYEYQYFYRTGLYIWLARRVCYKKYERLTLREVVLWCPLRCQNKNDIPFVFTSSCSCLTYVICFCLRIVVSNTYCVVFLFWFSSSCVRYIASFTGLSIFGSLFGNLLRLFKTKWDDFNFAIINVSHCNSNIPTALAYWINILQLIR